MSRVGCVNRMYGSWLRNEMHSLRVGWVCVGARLWVCACACVCSCVSRWVLSIGVGACSHTKEGVLEPGKCGLPHT